MSRISFENYGKRARGMRNSAQASGRYAIQEETQRRILPDVVRKLEIEPEDRMLEIGCGIGVLLIPLSFLVAQATGVDHASCLQRLRRTFHGQNVELAAGNFLDLKLAGSFDKILCYSVLHYLADEDEVFRFVARALTLLSPGGRALFGDLPNESRKQRFLASRAGKAFARGWEKEVKRGAASASLKLPADPQVVRFDDELLLKMCGDCRRQGFDAFILPQAGDLPFGHTREDLLVVRPS